MLWDSILQDRTLRHVSWPSIENKKELIEYIESTNTITPDAEIAYALHKEQKIIGTIHLLQMKTGLGETELGYAIQKDFEGKGLMFEALSLVEAELAKQGFKRIEIRCDVKNERSSRLAKRLNYILERTILQDTTAQGLKRDTLVFAKNISTVN